MTNIEAFKSVLKTATETNKLNIGAETTVKLLSQDGIETVYIAKNTKEEVKSDIEHYCKIAQVPAELLDIDSEELGILCKKPFKITIVAVKR